MCTGPGSIRDKLWKDKPPGARRMDYFSNSTKQMISCDIFTSGSGILVSACDVSSAHVTLNLKSCTAKLSQKPSMANLEAAYTSLNTTPTKKCTRFRFRRPTSDSFFHAFVPLSIPVSCIHHPSWCVCHSPVHCFTPTPPHLHRSPQTSPSANLVAPSHC